MWRSRLLWWLFGTHLLLWLATIGLLGAILLSQSPDTGLGPILATVAIVSVLGAIAGAYWLASRLLLPLRELRAGAECIAAGVYGYKIYAAGHDELGQLAQMFNAMSERLASQFAQLTADRQQMHAVLSSMIEGVVAVDPEQRILFANERAAQLLEFEFNGAVGRKLWQIVRQRALHDFLRDALISAEHSSQELKWIGPKAKNLTVHVTRLQGALGPSAVLVIHDTTELRRLERLRQDFVANVSHELKTPLAVIQANTETLLDGAVDDVEHRNRFLTTIGEQAHRLHILILDLLSLARIEAGTEAFAFQAVPLGPVIASCLERHRARTVEKNQVLETSPPAPSTGNEAEIVAWADEEAVDQILENLVDNAVKYTPAGGHIRVTWGYENGAVCMDVSDTGIGIPEADLPRVFERFYRVDKARSRELGGTGLGLAIVKHLIEAMHGSVQARSRLGQGTTFRVRLPRAMTDGSS